jgi:hypothetical protein
MAKLCGGGVAEPWVVGLNRLPTMIEAAPMSKGELLVRLHCAAARAKEEVPISQVCGASQSGLHDVKRRWGVT